MSGGVGNRNHAKDGVKWGKIASRRSTNFRRNGQPSRPVDKQSGDGKQGDIGGEKLPEGASREMIPAE
jgi:hypothetical protein